MDSLVCAEFFDTRIEPQRGFSFFFGEIIDHEIQVLDRSGFVKIGAWAVSFARVFLLNDETLSDTQSPQWQRFRPLLDNADSFFRNEGEVFNSFFTNIHIFLQHNSSGGFRFTGILPEAELAALTSRLILVGECER